MNVSKVRAISSLSSMTISKILYRHASQRTVYPLAVRRFSASSPRRIMELTGFSQEQLDVREAVGKICSNFPDDYWAERDESGVYPDEFHAALAKDGWIGIALPEDLGGAGLGISEATMMLQTISQSGAGMAGAQSIHANVYATQPVAKFATNIQKKRMLPRLISGEWKVCFGVTEPRLGVPFDSFHYACKSDSRWGASALD